MARSPSVPALSHARPSLAGLSLRDLEYAVAVGELRHFGLAAARCAVSQPALSGQIRKLEDLLGIVLFERSNRRVAPTARGEALLHQAARVLAEARGLMEMAATIADPLTGALHLGVIATLGPYYMPYLLAPVRAEFPGLALRLTEGHTDALLDQLRRGGLDAVLLALPVPSAQGAAALVSEALFFEPFRLVVPHGHKLAALRRPALRDLTGDDLILMDEGHCLRDQALTLCHRAADGPRAREATSVEMLWHMIAAGEGYSLLPLLALHGRAATASIVAAVALDDATAGRTIGLAWRATDPRAAEFARLCDFLRSHRPLDPQGNRLPLPPAARPRTRTAAA